MQMELEQIKEGQKDIKWEHEDDVSSCRKCEKPLNVTQDKVRMISPTFMTAVSNKVMHS